MDEFLKLLMGKKVDVSCGSSAAFRGEIVDVRNGILFLRDNNDNVAYIVIDKIAMICEVKECSTRPGFVA